MVSWWVIYSYSNNEQIQIGDIEIMNSAFGSSISFESRDRSKYIDHNTYTYIKSNFSSKLATINGPVHNSELKFSHSRRHFCQLPQTFYKIIINSLSQKVSYNSMIVDPAINGFSIKKVRSGLYICDH